jgi:hypothetical protein
MMMYPNAGRTNPTANQLALGSFVIPFSDSDPTTQTNCPEGLTYFWLDSGDIKLSIFDRTVGWKTTTLT